MNQEQIFKIQMIEQESNQLNQQLELIQQNVVELEELKVSIIEIDNSNQKEFLVNLGKRIYAPVEIKNQNLIIEVGNKTFVKKDIKGTLEIIDTQLQKLEEANMKIMKELERLQDHANELMSDIQQNSGKDHKHNHKHKHKDHECKCEGKDKCDEEEDCECED